MSAVMLPRLHIHCLVAAGFLGLPEAEDPYEANEAMKFAFRPGGGCVYDALAGRRPAADSVPGEQVARESCGTGLLTYRQ